jgi:hypothetical protein
MEKIKIQDIFDIIDKLIVSKNTFRIYEEFRSDLLEFASIIK